MFRFDTLVQKFQDEKSEEQNLEKAEDIRNEEIVLVGRSTRIPRVQQLTIIKRFL